MVQNYEFNYAITYPQKYFFSSFVIPEYDEDESYASAQRYHSLTPTDNDLPLSDLENTEVESQIKSVVAAPNKNLPVKHTEIDRENDTPQANNNSEPNSTDAPTIKDPSVPPEISTLPLDILEALGDEKGKEEIFGPNIPDEISKRWDRVLVDGLTKEQKDKIMENTLIPDNFRLAKAPLLNTELIPVLSDASRNRDKLLEKSQNQLGVGISGLSDLATSVINGNTDKIELLKKISDISKIFLDLHYEDTKRRRKLVASSLDKKFLNMITDVKRDSYLFGTNLSEKIKASKSAERSGLQIKRNDAVPSTSKRYPNQGNWRGPPRTQGHRTQRQGGQRTRYTSQYPQSNRRPPPVAERRPPPSKTNIKPRKTQ